MLAGAKLMDQATRNPEIKNNPAALLMGSSYELSPEHLEGDLWALLAGLFYAFYLIAIDRARRTLAPMPVLAPITRIRKEELA